MPVKPKRRPKSKVADPLSVGAFTFFANGDYFEGEDYLRATTEEERREAWAQYKPLYIERHRSDRHPGSDRPSYGEILEGSGKL